MDTLYTLRDINFRRLLLSPAVSCRLLLSSNAYNCLSSLPNHNPKGIGELVDFIEDSESLRTLELKLCDIGNEVRQFARL